METLPQQLAATARLMFERRLTDMAGGNISAREGQTVYVSPRYAGSKQHWQLSPHDFVSGSLDKDEILSHPRLSREAKVHIAIYREFPDAMAVLHGHPFHVQPFAAAGRPIEPVLEANDKFGVIPVVEGAPAHSQELSQYVVEGLRGQEARIRKQAAAVLMPRHGIVVVARDLLAGIDALERIDWNAWCILAQKLLPG